MTQDTYDSTRVMPLGSGTAGATQMGGTVTCAVCQTPNPALETYCVECGFLLASTPGALEERTPDAAEGPELVESATGRRFKLRAGINTVGRENCDILLMDGTVSRRHAEIAVENGAVTITDLGSTNGTQVDGRRIAPRQPTPVPPGGVLRLGNATLTLPGAPAPAEATLAIGAEPTDDRTLVAPPVEEASAPATEETEAGLAAPPGASRLRPNAPGAPDILLQGASLTLGRRPANDIALDDAYVSGYHAELSFEDGRWHIRDLRSTNGVVVNGTKITPDTKVALMHGDEVAIGQSSWVFESAPEAGEPADMPDEMTAEEDEGS